LVIIDKLDGMDKMSAKCGELPVELASKYDLVVNLKTAKALSLVIPQSIMVRADDASQST